MKEFRHSFVHQPWPFLLLRGLLYLAVTFGLGYVLYRQLFVDRDAYALFVGFRQNFLARPRWLELAFIVALMPINLWLEAYKLRAGMPVALRPKWGRAMRQVCSGIAAGLWTPGRIGEFGGRLIETPNVRERAYVLASTTIGGLAQWVPLLLGGGTAVLFWRKLHPELVATNQDVLAKALASALQSDWTAVFAYGAIVLALAICVGFWRKPQVMDWVQAHWPKSWKRKLPQGLKEVEAGPLLLGSLARYTVYLLQMSLALQCFGMSLDLISLLGGTAALFLLHGFLPLPPALQALARVEMALLIFAFAKPNELVILAASAFIFALNLALPALLGWWFIVRPNVKTD